MLDVENGAQQDRFPGGTQQIAEAAAAELGAACRAQRAGASHRAAPRRRRARSPPTAARPRPGSSSSRFRRRTAPPSSSLPRCRPSTTTRPALAAGPAEQGLRGLRDAVLAGQRVLRARRCPTRARCSSPSTSARNDDGPGILMGFVDARAFDSLPAEQRRARRAALLRGAVRRRGAQAHRLCRSSLGCRGIRTGRSDRGGAAGVVDTIRAVATRAGRADLSGPAPRPPTSGRAFSTAPSGPASGRPPRSRPCYELIRRIPAA